jgi:hypothetical protein
MNSGDGKSDPGFWREVLKLYGLPIAMFALAIIPGLNFTSSGHGGISWLLLPAAVFSVRGLAGAHQHHEGI